MMRVEKWILKKQQKKGFSLIKALLYFCGIFYSFLVMCRHILYDIGCKKKIKAAIPVISVGNIVCGGTGKSEFVAKLIKDLKRDDIAIISRGYRSRRKGQSRLVKDIDDGDEPFMLQNKFINIPVIVGKKREESVQFAASIGAKLSILDDGMQYIKLKKDLQIVLLRAEDPFGSGFVPYGMRREIIKKLNTVDYIIIHGAQSLEKYELVKRSVLCYSNARCFGTLYCLKKNKELIGKKVGVFCGIGNPQAFMKGLSKLDLKIIKKNILADHQKFTSLSQFYRNCRNSGGETVVCTTKDYVKLNEQEKKLVTPIQISMEVAYELEEYKALINQINNNIAK